MYESASLSFRKGISSWFWTGPDGVEDPIGHPTRKDASAAALACLATRAMNVQERTRRAELRGFVHPGCERVRLDELVTGDIAWFPMKLDGVPGDRYPTYWRRFPVREVMVIIPDESIIVHFTERVWSGGDQFLLFVQEWARTGANRITS
jgi:hypothetical protein